jgi:aldose 1-epimerase
LNDRCTVTARRFGQLPDGTSVTRATLANAAGIEVDVISYGGIITRLLVPDARGRLADIVLGLDSLEDYLSPNPYLGALIGRYGNRIAYGRFDLDGKTYRLDCNDGAHHLHGGVQGFDKKNWLMETFESGSGAGVVMTLTSPDGDQGYPGRVDIRAVYELSNADELELTLRATTDKPTIVNLTQHSYFNLAGRGDVLDHRLQIGSDIYIPVGADQIPTGELQRVAASPFDFRQPKAIGQDIEADHEQLRRGSGYDHTFVLKTQATNDLLLAARVAESVSGRVLEVLTVEPGLHFYSGNGLVGDLQGKGRVLGRHSGFCLEPQHFPDSPNQAGFPSVTLLPDVTYQSRVLYRFSAMGQRLLTR